MSTRTTGKRETLAERITKRWVTNGEESLFVINHVRAEYDGLARAIRKIKRELEALLHSDERDAMVEGRIHGLNDALSEIKRRKQ